MERAKMRDVYILTREGRAYTTEGLEYLINNIYEDYGIDDQLLFTQGSVINDPIYLASQLKKAPLTPVIVLSTPDDIITIAGERNIEIVIEILTQNPDETSWSMLVDSCKQDS